MPSYPTLKGKMLWFTIFAYYTLANVRVRICFSQKKHEKCNLSYLLTFVFPNEQFTQIPVTIEKYSFPLHFDSNRS